MSEMPATQISGLTRAVEPFYDQRGVLLNPMAYPSRR